MESTLDHDLASLAFGLFAQSFIQAHIKESIKALRHWSFWGIHRWQMDSPHTWPVKRKKFFLMTSSWQDNHTFNFNGITSFMVVCIYALRYNNTIPLSKEIPPFSPQHIYNTHIYIYVYIYIYILPCWFWIAIWSCEIRNTFPSWRHNNENAIHNTGPL